MREYNFPDRESHKTDHEKLGIIIEQLRDEYNKHGISSKFTDEVKSTLIQYWTEHIPKFDKPLAAFLKNEDN